jgi:glycosyltransferase involved in cell wall biosynthesis
MLFCRLIARGHGVLPAARFVHSRHFESQVLLPRSDLVFLTSVPYTYGQSPWVIEIEDSTSLFHPFVHNGETGVMNPQQSPYFAMVRDLLESDRCRAIITHMRSTAESLARLFDRETITSKVFHIPLGVRTPPRLVRRKTRSTIDLLFTNSWHQDPRSFFLRGGLDVLEAFSILRERYPQLRLTLRTSIPPLAPRHRRMLMQDGIRVLGNFLADEQMEELLEQTAIFVLPAARVHIVSVLRAMAHAQAVIVSDGWGFDELIDHERTGLIVPGRSGKTSWLEPNTGILREDYRPLFEPDPVVVEGLIEAVSRLVEDADLCERLGQSARAHVEENHSLERWNAGLKAVFDQVAPRR